MKALLLCVWLLAGQGQDSLRVVFWNLENFFDWRSDSTSVADAEFSSFGGRHWTRRRFQAKCEAVAKSLLWAASGPLDGLPDAVGVAEVENAFVLRHLLQTTALRKLDYRMIHFDSPDPRGIDVALLYRKSRLQLLDARPCHLYEADGSVMATRDILLARFVAPDGEELAFLVNHHPSKYGGTTLSEPRRRVAVDRLRFLADSLLALGVRRIVAMGDFNDTPANPVYARLQPALRPLSDSLYHKGEGSIKYDGAWELIDLFFASEACRALPVLVLNPPFLQEEDRSHGGFKPLRTYSGPRYLGGVSDHCPVAVVLLLH